MEDLNAPATKGDLQKFATKDDLQQLEERLTRSTQQLEERLTRSAQQLEERLMEGMRDIQTEMLKAFYSYAQSADLRMRESDTMTHGMRERLAAVESRITEIERRLNMPPAA